MLAVCNSYVIVKACKKLLYAEYGTRGGVEISVQHELQLHEAMDDSRGLIVDNTVPEQSGTHNCKTS